MFPVEYAARAATSLSTNTDTPGDNNNINNNHAALMECSQPSTLHKLRQLGLSTNTDTPDDNDINNKNLAALAECFQPSTLHKLRQPGLYTDTGTPDDNNISNNDHAALAERFQPSTLHKLRQLGRYTNTDTPDTAHQLDAEAVPAEVAYHQDQHAAELFRRGRIGPCPYHLQGGHGRSTLSYIVTVANAPIIFKVELQGLTAQPTMEAELVATALTVKEGAIFFSNMMLEMDFGESFGSVPLYVENTSALHVASNRTYSLRASISR